MSLDLLSRSARRQQGSLLEYISPSRLNCWLACPLKLKLRYIDGIRSPPTASLFVGKLCHSGLECHYRHRQLGITLDADDVCRRTLDGWDDAIAEEGMRFDSEADETKARRQASDLIRAYLAHVPGDEPRPLGVEARMQEPLVDPLTGENLGIDMLGIVDLVIEGRDDAGQPGPIVADFKTAARGGAPLEISHEIQLSSYSYLFRRLDGRNEAGIEIRSLIKTKTPRIEFHRFEPRGDMHFRRLFSVVRAYLDDIDAGRFVYRPGFGCGMCEFRETHCRGWSGVC